MRRRAAKLSRVQATVITYDVHDDPLVRRSRSRSGQEMPKLRYSAWVSPSLTGEPQLWQNRASSKGSVPQVRHAVTAVIRPSANPGPQRLQGPQRIGRWTLQEGLLASQWVMPTRSFETLICRLFRDKLGMPPDRSPSWQSLSPGDMAVQLKRFRQVAVAIPEVRISGGIAVRPRQKSPQPQQPDVAYHQTLIGWRGR
jgi:hypothetical protein